MNLPVIRFQKFDPPRLLDSAVEWIMGVLLVFTPLAFGSTQAWSQEVVLGLVAAAVLCVALKRLTGRYRRLPWSWAYPVIFAFVGLCLFQLIPLPASVLRAIAPGTLKLKSSLLADLPNSAAALSHQTITFYSWATIHQLILLVAVAAVFVLVIDVYRDSRRIARLLATIALVGLAVALLAIYQNLTDATTVYGVVMARHKHCGPFMIYSHFDQFMNLSIGAAFGLLLVRLSTLSACHRTTADWVEAAREPANAFVWVLLVFCVLGPITVFLSMGRMGMISLLTAAAITAAMVSFRARPQGGRKAPGYSSVLVLLGIVVLAGLLYFGFDAVSARLATVDKTELTEGVRFQMLKDILIEWKTFPVFGSGLGTHQFVFQAFNRLNVPGIPEHAENEYAEMLGETGLLGVLLVVAFIAIVTRNYFRATATQKEPIQFAVFGLGFGLSAILIHSASDFGQHLPANAILTAIFAGLLVNLARAAKSDDFRAEPFRGERACYLGLGLRVAGVACVVAIFVPALLWANKAREAESLWAAAELKANALEKAGWRGSSQDYVELLKPATAASALAPGDIEYAYFLNGYRWHAASHDSMLADGGMVLPPAVTPIAARIVSELEAIRPLCPTYGPPECVAGQLKALVLHDPSGEQEIKAAYALAPYDRTVCLIWGALAVREKLWDDSVAAFSHYVALQGSPRDFLDAYIRASRPDIAYRIISQDRSSLDYMASRMPTGPVWDQWIAKCHRDSIRLLVLDAAKPEATAETIASLAEALQRQGRNSEAVDLYRRALAANYGQLTWRLQLSKALGDLGRFRDAIEQLRICLSLRPDWADVKVLLADYSARERAQGMARQ
jgi:O-antigen ligase/tetratricopeptide (TPR) repeat protein